MQDSTCCLARRRPFAGHPVDECAHERQVDRQLVVMHTTTQATERAAGQRAGALSREHRNEHRHCWGERQCCRFFPGWDGIANDAVAILRAEAGRDPYDRRLSDLIGELSTRSEEFRVRWAAHNVKFHRTGAKNLHLRRWRTLPCL
jgi:MmyB-like transcription regulator ligand binding domain